MKTIRISPQTNFTAAELDARWAAFRALPSAERLSTYLRCPKRALEPDETPEQAWAAYWAIVNGDETTDTLRKAA